MSIKDKNGLKSLLGKKINLDMFDVDQFGRIGESRGQIVANLKMGISLTESLIIRPEKVPFIALGKYSAKLFGVSPKGYKKEEMVMSRLLDGEQITVGVLFFETDDFLRGKEEVLFEDSPGFNQSKFWCSARMTLNA